MTNKEAIESAMQYIKAARRSVQIAIGTLEDVQEERLSILAAQHYANLGIFCLELEIKLKEEDESAKDS